MRWLADFVYLIAGVLYLPIALYHALVLKKNRGGWGERFGGVARRDPARRRVWIHAVSLGETNATPKLVAKLRERLPEAEFVFSSTTDTGYARAVELYGREAVFRFPLDFSLVIDRALARIRPNLIVLVELEVWYNLVHLAFSRNIPVAVINGRLTERSARRLAWLGKPVRSMFARLAWVGAQDETIAARFRALGVPAERIDITSSLKWDTAAVADRVDGAEALAAALGIDAARPLWVCGSTGPGEEEIILDAYRRLLDRAASEVSNPPPQLAIVPRKPERFDEVARLIEARGFACVRRSRLTDGGDPMKRSKSQAARSSHASEPFAPAKGVTPTETAPAVARAEIADRVQVRGACANPPAAPEHSNTARSAGGTMTNTVGVDTRAAGVTDAPASVVLGDTMGELRKFYSLAGAVFVGRSMVPMGGSDPMEVAALAKPMIAGPHMENFQTPTDAFRAGGAISIVHDASELAAAIASSLGDPVAARAKGQSAQSIVRANQGATQQTADRLTELFRQAVG